ncbi:MAG: acetolactate synthase [Clostridiales bacterium]|jgi:hypothetical protein|nr:acetolactate synthase [Clostridiales bacterium]
MFKQLTVFLENKTGRIEDVTGCLASEKINLHALSIADTADFGILRMVVSDPDKAVAALKEKNFMVKTADVIAVPMGHNPGSLHKVLSNLKELDISIKYMYAFTSRHKEYDSIVILRLHDQEKALEKISGISILGQELLDCLNES